MVFLGAEGKDKKRLKSKFSLKMTNNPVPNTNPGSKLG